MNPKILIVDDKVENLIALERLLGDIEVDIVRAGSGNEALSLTLEHDFALVLLDVQMPDMDGFETLKIMRQQAKTSLLPVIFVSAIFNEESHVIKGVETGAVDFIVKPIVPELLIGKVKIFLELFNQKKSLEHLAHNLKEREQTFKSLAEGLLAEGSDKEILSYIVSTIATIFNTEHSTICRFDDVKAETVACFRDGQKSAPRTCDLSDSPCSELKDVGNCLYVDGVCQQYPQDHNLKEMGIDGYVGVALKDRKGNTLGCLNAFSKTPLQLPEYASEVLGLIANRTATILARQRAQQNKKILQARLQQAQKMEAIGTLAGGIAHDFNNILTPIMGYAEMSKSSLEKDNPLYTNLQQVIEASHRAKSLVQQILTFSRQSVTKVEPLIASLVVKEALKLLRSTIPTTIEIRQEIDSDSGLVKVDPTHLHQIMMNLCTNAYHAMQEEGGTLSVSLQRINCDGVADFDTKQMHGTIPEPGEYVKLEISDTGSGMDKDILLKIFDPYFTTKAQGEGTGLGLAVVSGIIEKCHGFINVVSEPGKGTTFHIYFPLILQDQKPAVSAGVVDLPTGNEQVMVVDDEDQICKMIRRMLEGLGYKVDCFNKPEDALEQFLENVDFYNLIITDMTMPGMTGKKLAEKFFEAKPDAAIILCTGFSELIDEDKTKELGIKYFLTKPISFGELATTVRNLLDS